MEDHESIIQKANEQQAKASQSPIDRHVLVVAGPGTGKTKTIVDRCHFLLSKDVPALDIQLASLTRAASRQLAEKCLGFPTSTLHSLALRQLNILGDAPRHTVPDPWETDQLVLRDIQRVVRLRFGLSVRKDKADDFLKKLAKGFRSDQRDPPQLSGSEQRLFEAWEWHREFMRYRLFEEMWIDLVEYLEQGHELERLPQHILIDEYQDLTPIELRALHLMANRGTRLFAVGDDRQSIFGFREADELALHRFKDVYESEDPIPLTVSFRCPTVVCRLAEEIAKNLPPLPGFERPTLRSDPRRDESGCELGVHTFPSNVAEARWIARRAQQLIAEGVEPRQILIIAPSYSDICFRILSEEGAGVGVTFEKVRRADALLSDPALRWSYGLARLVEAPDDQLAWRTLIHLTPRIGEAVLDNLLQSDASSLAEAIRSVGETRPQLGNFVRSVESAVRDLTDNDNAPTDIVHTTIERAEALASELGASPAFDEFRRRIEDLLASDPSLGIISAVRTGLETRGQNPDAPMSAEEMESLAVGTVPFMTIHSAKGLEADHVFIMNAITECFSAGSLPDADRRLFVAVTRSRRTLHITAPRMLIRGLDHAVGKTTVKMTRLVTLPLQRLGIALVAHPKGETY